MPQTSPACRPAAAAHGPLRTGVLGATAAALATLPVAKALALDLDGDMGLITETVASRDRLKSYDSIKLYGAERVADRDRQYVLPDGMLAGTYLIFPSLGAAVVYDDNIFKSNADKRSDVRSEITPSLRFTSQLPRHVLDLSLDGRIVSYLDNPDQDYADIRARLDGALHFDHATRSPRASCPPSSTRRCATSPPRRCGRADHHLPQPRHHRASRAMSAASTGHSAPRSRAGTTRTSRRRTARRSTRTCAISTCGARR